MGVLINTIKYVSIKHPLQFYGIPGVALVIAGLVLGSIFLGIKYLFQTPKEELKIIFRFLKYTTNNNSIIILPKYFLEKGRIAVRIKLYLVDPESREKYFSVYLFMPMSYKLF